MARSSRGFQPSSRDRHAPMSIDTSAFPDEVTVDLDDKDPNNFVIEEIDDTPEDDKGRPTEVENSVLDEEELRGISKRTQNRINRLKFETETERRGREAAERQLAVAVEEARIAKEEAERLKAADGPRTQALGSAMLARVDAGMANAKAKLAKAIEEGNAKDQAEATAEISSLSAEKMQIQSRIPRAAPAGEQQKPAGEQQKPAQDQQRQQPIDPEVVEWIGKNTWFNQPEHSEKTRIAYAINEELLAQGERDTRARLQKVDKRLKAMYPDDYKDGRGQQRGSRRPDAVADSSRESEGGGGSPRKVTLTSSQLAIAKKLGVTPQAYAAQVLARQEREGTGA